MKVKAIQLIVFMIFVLSFNTSSAQMPCSRFYSLTEGVKTQITAYNKRGKVSAVTDYKVNTYVDDIAEIDMVIKDKKGKILAESSYKISCNDKGVSIGNSSLISPQISKQLKNFDFTIDGKNIDYPNNLEKGMDLPDASMNVNMNMSGIKMNLVVRVIDRVVEGMETITTPSGTYECYVISYMTSVKMGIKKTNKSKQWISEGVGLVKQEDYNRKGKVTSSSLLTQFSN